MKSINYVVAAAMLFAACMTLCFVDVGSADADPAAGELGYKFVEGGITYEITTATDDPSVHGAAKLHRVDLSITDCTVPASVSNGGFTYDVTELGSYCFYSSYSNVKSLTLPEGLISIGDQAFSQCSIDDIVIPSTVESISDNSFFNTSFNSISVAEGNTHYLFENNTLFGLNNSSEKTKILVVLDNFDEVVNYVIPDTVTHINSMAFANVNNLGNVVIPSSITSVGNEVFYGSGVENVVWSASVNIPSECFRQSDLVSITFNQMGGINIGNYAFYYSDLEFLTFSPGSYAVELGSNIIYSTKLTELVLPEGLTTIKENCFQYAKSLQHIVLPSSLTTVERFAFENCTALESIEVSESCAAFIDYDARVLLNASGTIIHAYAAANSATSYEIPNTVITINPYAFYGAKNLTSLTFQDESHLTSVSPR